jgi:hypothetical protein
VLDGYFPSEWRTAYPQGVVLELRDETDKTYAGPGVAASASAPAPPGAGATSSAAASSGGGGRGAAASAIASLASLGGDDLAVMPAHEFISRLPTRVIRGGNVISVRDDLAAMLMGPASAAGEASAGGGGPDSTAMVVADTPWAHGPTAAGADGTAPAVATVQVKSGDGLQTLVVRLPVTATVAELRRVIDAHRAHATRYELRTAYPRKALENDGATLAEAKLAPSAVVHMRSLDGEAAAGGK